MLKGSAPNYAGKRCSETKWGADCCSSYGLAHCGVGGLHSETDDGRILLQHDTVSIGEIFVTFLGLQDTEDEGNTLFRNVGKYLLVYTA
jgi:hypothetical protein